MIAVETSLAVTKMTDYATKSTTLAGYGITDGAKKDLSNLTAHTTIDTSTPVDYVICRHTESDGSWVRIWKSGWVEQGGYAPGNSYGDQTFNLSVTYNNAKYFLAFQKQSPVNVATNTWAECVQNKTTSSFSTWLGLGGYNDMTWYACGQGDATSIAQYIASL